MSRIHEMIAKERRLNGVNLGKEFEKELDNIIDENTDLKIENKRLKKTIAGLWSRLSTLTTKVNTWKQPVSY